MTTAALTPASSGARYQVIPIKQLRESPTNPRKSFGDMAEFTKNVTQHGILEPIIVRCVDSSAQAFEIVCGHRRYRAAKAAGFQEIPSIIRELGDGQVLEMQLVENCQRSDFDYGNTPKKGWVDLEGDVVPYYDQRKWKTVLGKHAPKSAIAVDDNGQVHHLVREKDARKALKEAKVKIKERPSYSSGYKPSASEKESAKKRKEREAIAAKVLPIVRKQIIEKVETTAPDAGFWRALAEIALDAVYGAELPKRWGYTGMKPLLAQLEKMSERKARALFVDAFLEPLFDDAYGSEYSPLVKDVSEAFEVSIKKVEAEISGPAKPSVPVKIVVKTKAKSSKKSAPKK